MVDVTRSADIDAAVQRLFTLLGESAPAEGSVIFDFHEGLLRKVRPTRVITIAREKRGLASAPSAVHTRARS